MATNPIKSQLEFPKAAKGNSAIPQTFLSGFSAYLAGRRTDDVRSKSAVTDERARSAQGGTNSPSGGNQKGNGSPGRPRGRDAANRAITTRNAKYGNTKLKRPTERALRQSGANVNPPVTTPKRSGRTAAATKARVSN